MSLPKDRIIKFPSAESKACYPLHCVQCACSYFGGLSLYRANLARDDPALTRSGCLSDSVQAKSCRIILHTQQHGMKIAQDDHVVLAVVWIGRTPQYPRGGTTWTGDFKCREVKTGFCRKRWMQTGSSGTLIGWKSGQTTYFPLWDRGYGLCSLTQQ